MVALRLRRRGVRNVQAKRCYCVSIVTRQKQNSGDTTALPHVRKGYYYGRRHCLLWSTYRVVKPPWRGHTARASRAFVQAQTCFVPTQSAQLDRPPHCHNIDNHTNHTTHTMRRGLAEMPKVATNHQLDFNILGVRYCTWRKRAMMMCSSTSPHDAISCAAGFTRPPRARPTVKLTPV